MPVTTGMKGGGFYDDHSAPQMASIEAVLPWLEEAVGEADLPARGGPIVVADFACSEGKNSIAAAKRIIAALRKRDRRPSRPSIATFRPTTSTSCSSIFTWRASRYSTTPTSSRPPSAGRCSTSSSRPVP